MKNITLRQLRYFSAVAETSHFGRAADQCAVTQPALSMQVKELETELGAPLFERSHAGLRLTPMGEDVAKRAHDILAAVQDLSDLAASRSEPLSGDLRLGVIPTVAPYLLPTAFARLRADYPELDLHIRETQTDLLTKELVHGRLDAAVFALPVEHNELETAFLFDDPFVLAVPASSVDSDGAPNDILRRSRVLLLDEGHCLRDQALDVCRLRPPSRVDTLAAASLTTVVQCVASGLGVTLLPEISIEVEAGGQDVRLIDFREPKPSREIGLAWRKSSPRRADFLELAEVLKEARPGRA